MKKSQARGLILTGLLLLTMAGLATVFFSGRSKGEPETVVTKERSQVLQENGKTVIVLAPALQKNVGILSQPITRASESTASQTAYGSVIALPDVSDLLSRMAVAQADLSRAKANSVSARAAYQKAQATRQTAQAALHKVQVNLDISRRSYERLRTLNADNRNVSAKTVESAEGTYQGTQSDIQTAQAQIQSSQADLLAAQGQMMLHQVDQQAAQSTIQSIQEAAIQRLGPAISRWMLAGSPQFERLLQRQEMLVQVTLPNVKAPPQTLSLQTADQVVLSAHYAAPAIQVDPKIQGASFTYTAPSANGALLPGMNVIATLPGQISDTSHPFSIPASAVVWWEGKPWAYVRTQSDRFIRRPISGKQVQDHWLVRDGFQSQDHLVVQGAQLLLSQEFQSQYQGE